MAVADRTIDPILFQCAKEEFLIHGYDNTSMNEICKKANITTGALFKRYTSKLDLFNKIIEKSVEKLQDWFIKEQEDFFKLDKEEKINVFYNSKYHIEIMNIIYDNYDDFKIIVDRSSLIQYSNFLDFFVEIETSSVIHFINEFKPKLITNNEISYEIIHIIITSYFNGLFEVIKHNFKKEEAILCAKQLYDFYNKAWHSLLKLDRGNNYEK